MSFLFLSFRKESQLTLSPLLSSCLSQLIFPYGFLSNNLQALVAETEALDWDGPVRLKSLPLEHPKQITFGLIGKLLSAKPPHPQWVSDTLIAA